MNENVVAIQFNGWNFGYIEDWFYNTKGMYRADFKESFELAGNIIHRHDWVVKRKDGSFKIMTPIEYEELTKFEDNMLR